MFENANKGSGAVFSVPYRDLEYNIWLPSPDLDRILSVGKGLTEILGIKLPNGDLHLHIWPKKIDEDSGAGWDVMMDVSVATRSSINEHRGVLTVVGSKSDFGWSEHDWWKVGYETLPALKEPQPDDLFYPRPA